MSAREIGGEMGRDNVESGNDKNDTFLEREKEKRVAVLKKCRPTLKLKEEERKHAREKEKTGREREREKREREIMLKD